MVITYQITCHVFSIKLWPKTAYAAHKAQRRMRIVGVSGAKVNENDKPCTLLEEVGTRNQTISSRP